jgi:acyl-CoA dehydrogenase
VAGRHIKYLVERLYHDSRILSIGGGTTEIMKEIIGNVAQF